MLFIAGMAAFTASLRFGPGLPGLSLDLLAELNLRFLQALWMPELFDSSCNRFMGRIAAAVGYLSQAVERLPL